MIVVNRRQPLPTAKAAFADDSGKTNRSLSRKCLNLGKREKSEAIKKKGKKQ